MCVCVCIVLRIQNSSIIRYNLFQKLSLFFLNLSLLLSYYHFLEEGEESVNADQGDDVGQRKTIFFVSLISILKCLGNNVKVVESQGSKNRNNLFPSHLSDFNIDVISSGKQWAIVDHCWEWMECHLRNSRGRAVSASSLDLYGTTEELIKYSVSIS